MNSSSRDMTNTTPSSSIGGKSNDGGGSDDDKKAMMRKKNHPAGRTSKGLGSTATFTELGPFDILLG